MKVAIIKYNAGNIMSVKFALQRLGINPEVTDIPEKLMNADKVIFPGVGEASTTMRYLKERNLDELLKGLKQPVLGICLGLQLMCRYSEEGDTQCIGIFNEEVKKFDVSGYHGVDGFVPKIPQIGWNSIYNCKSKLFSPASEGQYCYFVHSYFAAIGNDTAATSDYVVPFSAALQKDNFYATQFHPEKSGTVGAEILKNFIEL